MASSSSSPLTRDVCGWINSLPPLSQWKTNTMSLRICVSKSTQPPLDLLIAKSLQNQNPYISFSIVVDLNNLPTISLWTSKSFNLKSKTQQPLDKEIMLCLFSNLINDVLNKYGPKKSHSSVRLPSIRVDVDFRDIFNLAFLTLTLLVCIYEAPRNIRVGYLDTLQVQMTSSRSREASKLLVRVMGSNLEEEWMRSLNLAITNQIVELHGSFKESSSLLFSYAVSETGMWKVQFYCPVIAMNLENPSTAVTDDERLLFSLNFQQLEGVIQFAYKLIFHDNWIDVVVSVDNVRCDVNPLVSETLMSERGVGPEEKHFPSRVSLQLTPAVQSQSSIISVSVSKSSHNPAHEVGLERALEGTFDPPGTYLGLKVSAAETVTTSMRPWKFEQSVSGDSANLDWYLHDSGDGREVFLSRPSKMALFQPRSWFRDRYASAYRPFTKHGGVIFAGDEYGEAVWWKVRGSEGVAGRTMEWELKGSIWLTYWPNKHRTFYSETRRLDFREMVHLPLAHKPG